MPKPITKPARLDVVFRPESPFAVILRHQPAKVAASYSWCLATDRIELGQMLRGTIDPLQCDISVDGKHWLYTANKARGRRLVVARVPWLKALVVETPEVRSLAQEASDLVLSQDELHRSYSLRRVSYDDRLQQNGWKELEDHHFRKQLSTHQFLHLFFRPHPSHASERHDSYAISSGQTMGVCDGWEWADIVGDRLAWATEGCLFVAPLSNVKATADRPDIQFPKLLQDFNGQPFRRREAPY